MVLGNMQHWSKTARVVVPVFLDMIIVRPIHTMNNFRLVIKASFVPYRDQHQSSFYCSNRTEECTHFGAVV
jgi:hypothetical protein